MHDLSNRLYGGDFNKVDISYTERIQEAFTSYQVVCTKNDDWETNLASLEAKLNELEADIPRILASIKQIIDYDTRPSNETVSQAYATILAGTGSLESARALHPQVKNLLFSAETAKLNHQMTVLRAENEKLNKDLAARSSLQQAPSGLQSQLEQKDATISSLRQEIIILQSTDIQKTMTLSNLQHSTALTEKRLSDALLQRGVLENTAAKDKTALQCKGTELVACQEALAAEKAKVYRWNKTIAELQTQVDQTLDYPNLYVKYLRASSDLDETENDIVNLRQDLDAQREIQSHLSEENKRLSDQISKLEAKVDGLSAEKDSDATEIVRLQEELGTDKIRRNST